MITPPYFVVGIHGNEQIPVQVLQANTIPFILGNPEALKRNVRFIEKDLNASFGTNGLSLEEKRAKEILIELNQKNPEWIIDFHTTTAETEPFAIVVSLDLVPFAKTLGLKHIVYMKYNIKGGHALINYYPGVSIEAGTHTGSETAPTVEAILAASAQGKQNEATVYEVYEEISEEGMYENFKMNEKGFIPVLAGETSYDFYGLKARILTIE